jgi:dCMP deaminase
LSNDPRTQHGALLIKDGVPLTETASPNMPPAGVRLFGERLSNPTKRKVFECAERNAIYSAARLGIPTQGLTLVTPLVPCPHCARAIIQAGITELITLAKQPDSPAQRPATTALARAMLDEAGVKVTYYEGEIGGPTIRHDGEPFQP